jgi:hypothetical protein
MYHSWCRCPQEDGPGLVFDNRCQMILQDGRLGVCMRQQPLPLYMLCDTCKSKKFPPAIHVEHGLEAVSLESTACTIDSTQRGDGTEVDFFGPVANDRSILVVQSLDRSSAPAPVVSCHLDLVCGLVDSGREVLRSVDAARLAAVQCRLGRLFQKPWRKTAEAPFQAKHVGC